MLHLKQSIDVSGVSGNDFLTWRAGVLHTWWKWLNRNVLWKRCHWELFSVSRGGEVSIKCPILWWEQQHPFHGFSRWLFLILPFWNCNPLCFVFFFHPNKLEVSRCTDVMFLKSIAVDLQPFLCEDESGQGLHELFLIFCCSTKIPRDLNPPVRPSWGTNAGGFVLNYINSMAFQLVVFLGDQNALLVG